METRLKKFGTLFIDNKPYQTSDIVAPTELDGRKMEIGDTVPGLRSSGWKTTVSMSPACRCAATSPIRTCGT